MRLEAVGYFLIRLDRRISKQYCRRFGHAYDLDWTDICTVDGDAFHPAVWCTRCKRYVSDPRVTTGSFKGLDEYSKGG